MSNAIVCKPSPVKTLTVSRAPLRELLNFLTYASHPELLNERARKQPPVSLERVPSSVKDLKDVLGAEKCDKNEKLFFDCEKGENQATVLLHNQGAQFWIHYFRAGVGLVNLSFFSRLASAEGSLLNQTRSVTHSNQYQWFTHNLEPGFFTGEISEARIRKLGNYFIEQVNPNLISSYSIYYENPQIKEPYKFVSGTLERLKEVLTWTRFVCESLKHKREPNGKIWVSPHVTINCGSLKDAPTFECLTETFINAVGALAVKENSPYTVLREGFGRRAGGECFDWERKNKHQIFLSLEQGSKDVPVREKIAARAHLVNWLMEQGLEGRRVLETWKL
ncbi:MAG: hypothetical protein M3367_01740 [Acidobacteriota bacterium]|nr:hypothetical protein [Acidobacteriota bacterium]